MASLEKCIRKLSNIKFPRGVKLDNLVTIRRTTGEPKGVSLNADLSSRWSLIPGKGRALYKTYDNTNSKSETAKYSKPVRMYNELLCDRLCDTVGIEHAKYEPARYGKTRGLISYDVLRDGEILAPIITNPGFLGSFFEELGKNPNVSPLEIQEMIKTLYKYMLFDIRTMQSDRNMNNVPMAKHRVTGKLRVAPLMDNEFAYMSYNMLYNSMGGDDYFGTFSKSGDVDVREIVLAYDMKMNRTKSSYCLDVCKYQDERNLEDRIIEAVTIAQLSPELGEIFDEFMASFDIDKAIKELRKDGVKAPDEYIRYIKAIDSYIKERMEYHRERGEEYTKKYTESKPQDYSRLYEKEEVMHMLGIVVNGSSSISRSIYDNYMLYTQDVERCRVS